MLKLPSEYAKDLYHCFSPEKSAVSIMLDVAKHNRHLSISYLEEAYSCLEILKRDDECVPPGREIF